METIINIIENNIVYFWAVTALLVIILLILVIILLIKNKQLARKYDRFLRGKDAENLEDSFFEAYEIIKQLQQEDKVNKQDIAALKSVMAKTYQRMAVVRYNAFPGMGGNASCAVALLTQSLDGLVLNIVHSRESCYFYVKTVHNAKPDILLGKEEQQALDEALKEKPIKL
ncbi:MAG: DUF4446 family protein [Lachnospiraceae bacterium]|nr:DUF4446 family protein [Lachnospiraceae bacterium]